MTRLISIVTAGILLLGAGPLRADNIERSCKVTYSLHAGAIMGPRNAYLIKIADFIATPRASDGISDRWEFSVRRGCGRAVPNRCRERASQAALACMLAHQKLPGKKPEACTKDGVRDYPFDNLERNYANMCATGLPTTIVLTRKCCRAPIA